MNMLIVDLKGKYAAALTESGDIRRIVNNNYKIGDQIDLYSAKEINSSRTSHKVMKRIIAVAAALAVMALGSIGTAYALPYGTVSLESDPSIEYTINCFDYVIGVNALNDEGREILDDMDEKTLKHHKIEDAVKSTVEQMEKSGHLDSAGSKIEINAHTGSSGHTERLQKNLDTSIKQENEKLQKEENGISSSKNDDTAQNNEGLQKQDDQGIEQKAEETDRNKNQNGEADHAEEKNRPDDQQSAPGISDTGGSPFSEQGNQNGSFMGR